MNPAQTWLEGLQPAVDVDLALLRREAETFQAKAQAANTGRVYRCQWAQFVRFADSLGREYLPAEPATVELYVRYKLIQQGCRADTVEVHLAAIRDQHRRAGRPLPALPAVRTLLLNARDHRRETPDAKEPLTLAQVETISRLLEERGDAFSLRDRAVLVTGWHSALRRSNLAALELSDVRIEEAGVRLRVKRSKTDQRGRGVSLGLHRVGRRRHICPARVLEDWLARRLRKPGPLFTFVDRDDRVTLRPISDEVVAAVVKRAVCLIGLDPRQYAGHSTRAGFVTDARAHAVPDSDIMRRTGHRNIKTLGIYDRSRDPFSGLDPLRRF